jgi:organic radical activating enzyme
VGKRRSIRCVWCGSLNTKKHGRIRRIEFYLKSTKQKKYPEVLLQELQENIYTQKKKKKQIF